MMKNLLPRKMLFDGLESDLDKISVTLKLDNHQVIQFDYRNLAYQDFSSLKETLKESVFNEIFKQCDFKRSKLFGNPISKDEQSTYYSILKSSSSEEYILVFSLGEKQPGRYWLFVEGVWQNNAILYNKK